MLDLTPDSTALELAHSQDVFEYKGPRADLLEEANELPVQAVTRIVNQAIVIADLAVRLARRTTSKQIKVGALQRVQERFVLLPTGEVSFDKDCSWEIPPVRRAGIRVMIRSSNDVHTGVGEALAQASCAAKEVYCGEGFRLGHATGY